MRKKFLFITAALSCAALMISAVGVNSNNVKVNADNPSFDTTTFKPLSHFNGAEVDILPYSLSEWFSYDNYDASNLNALYEYNSEISSFTKYFISSSDYEDGKEAIREEKKDNMKAVFDKWDGFHPVNNQLTWTSNVNNLKEYRVIVSLDNTLTKVVYDEEHISSDNPSYTMENLLTNTDYYWQIRAIQNDDNVIYSPIYNFKTCSPIRTVDIDGVSNTRDIGGRTTEFGTLKQGLVYRGARLDEISSDGLNTFKNELHIKTDLDLRKDNEDEVPEKSKNITKVDNYVGPVDCIMYGEMSFNVESQVVADARRQVIKTIFKTFANPNNYPIYFHCTVGRDRTGSIGMVLDSLLGLSREEVLMNYWTSCFAVTGAFQKPLGDATILQAETVLDSVLAQYNKGSNVLNAEAYLLDAGLTMEEIQSIRNIMTGITPIPDPISTHEETINYKGTVMVNFKLDGEKDVSTYIAVGDIVSSPYTLPNGFAWFNGDEEVNLNDPIYESCTLVGKRIERYTLTVHYADGSKNDLLLLYKNGENVNFDRFKVEGKTLIIIGDNGKEISKLSMSRDTTVNLLYI